MSIATALVLLMASGKISYLALKEAALQVDQKRDEVVKLTVINKKLAKIIAETFLSISKVEYIDGTRGAASPEVQKCMENLLKEADIMPADIDKLLGRTNSVNKAP